MSGPSHGRVRLSTILADALRPPVGDRRFWVIQLLVVAIAIFHVSSHDNGALPDLPIPHFAKMSLFLVPVVYAALTFGLAGSLATAAWVSVLMTPDLISHQDIERWANGIQIGIIDVVAAFVGAKVNSETILRSRAEQARARYLHLFEKSQAPILVVAADGRVREMNEAARSTFRWPRTATENPSLAELVGTELAGALLAGGPLTHITVEGAGKDVIFKPLSKRLDAEAEELTEVVLQDITAEQRQQQSARAYAAHVLRAQENERIRIAAELHDEPLQSLLQLSRQLGDVKGASPIDDGGLVRTRELATTVAADLRRISRGLRPPSLDDLGIVSAIRQVLAETEHRLNVHTRLRVVGHPRRLAPEVELCIFRVAQEAIHNVEKHAQAGTLAIRVQFRADEVALLVADDGRGFDAARLVRFESSALGFLGMRERATMTGGRLAIRSRPGRGTTVRLAVPIPATRTADRVPAPRTADQHQHGRRHSAPKAGRSISAGGSRTQ